MHQIRSPQDFGAGILFLLIGLGGIYFGRDLAFGSTSNMGPGYFPTVISALITLIGVIIAIKSLSVDGPPIERIQIRPILFLMLALAAFGFLIAKIGVIFSAFLLIMLAAYARRDVNKIETVIFAMATSICVVLIFVYALGQPMPIWWGY